MLRSIKYRNLCVYNVLHWNVNDNRYTRTVCFRRTIFQLKLQHNHIIIKCLPCYRVLMCVNKTISTTHNTKRLKALNVNKKYVVYFSPVYSVTSTRLIRYDTRCLWIMNECGEVDKPTNSTHSTAVFYNTINYPRVLCWSKSTTWKVEVNRKTKTREIKSTPKTAVRSYTKVKQTKEAHRFIIQPQGMGVTRHELNLV